MSQSIIPSKRVSSREILEHTGLRSAKTLTRWCKEHALIPTPEIDTHPNGRGKMAYWPAWVLFRCIRIQQLQKTGCSLADMRGQLNEHEDEMVKNPKDLDEFQKFVRGIPKGKLVNLLCDAYWKNQLGKTEIKRSFLLSKKGVDITYSNVTPAGRNNGPDEKTKARRKTTRRRTAKSQVRSQRGRRS